MVVHRSEPTSEPLIIAHRGVSGHRYQNSIPAFMMAVENSAFHTDGIELDIHTTVDHRFVVHHDPALASGRSISEHRWDELRGEPLPDGSALPLLDEVLPLASRVELFIEVKGLPASADAALLGMLSLSKHGTRLHLHAFDHRVIARLSRQAPERSYGILSCSYPVHPLSQLQDAGASILWQEWPLIDRALVDACHAQGIRVMAWTVNDRDAADRLRQLGVDGLCGNWPERLRSATIAGS